MRRVGQSLTHPDVVYFLLLLSGFLSLIGILQRI